MMFLGMLSAGLRLGSSRAMSLSVASSVAGGDCSL